MNKSESLQSGSKSEPTQLPLKGFFAKQPSTRRGWERLIEGMGDGRYRIHTRKIKK